MKKKMVNVILSTAIAASMMFAVTACGSKAETTDTTVVETTTTEAASEAETTTEAVETTTTESDKNTDEVISLDDWLDSEDAAEFTAAMNQGLDGMSLEIKADGDVLAMRITMDETLEIVDGVEDAMEQAFESQAAIFESVRDELIDITGNSNIKVRIVYVNGDGTEIYSKEF